ALALPGHRCGVRDRLRPVRQRRQGLHAPLVLHPDLRGRRGRHLLPVPCPAGARRRGGLRHLDRGRRGGHRHLRRRPVRREAERRQGRLDPRGHRRRDRSQGGLRCL
ncbi:MAG: hypothetical protein AVDCRST_MAG52-3315, partial [uncultured Blastococcus sp.]